ncbi:MAG: DNA mismatch repair endonuclease MutL [Candidatus Marinimicrobia bacterium]|nr:DNA mismatch repair endonuclease MutL [Candidatus Neomarinimicrobiota bacterium]
MSKIKLLSSHLINQIAAGEVIERPFSVIKELVENSIDAKSSQIDILIEDGGHKAIQVFDNGIGMTKVDLELAFQRHATSKIATQDDLAKISTLGFRGEALPSIASVSQLTAKSIVKDNNDGFELSIYGGEVKSLEPIAGLHGTQISVKNLFYNIPARRKFLKKSDTEQRKIVELIRQFMLSNPNIGFSLSANSKEIYKVSPNTLEIRIKDIFGKNFSNSLLPVNLTKSPYEISGFTGNLNTTKKRQGDQYLFLNGRFIKDRLLSSAVFSAYKSLISRGEFPFFVLFLQVPLDTVDINVHPAKLEVRFQNEWHIYHVIKSAISNALEDILKVIPEYDPSLIYYNKPKESSEVSQLPFTNSQSNSLVENLAPREGANINLSEVPFGNMQKNDIEEDFRVDRAHERIVQSHTGAPIEKVVSDIIWQLDNKYLITEIKSGLIIIDQHVAHERVLYESARAAMDGNGMTSQTVLFPQTLTLQPDEYSNLLNIIPYLDKIGFKLREFGDCSVIIEGIPIDVNWGTEKEVIGEILEKYMHNSELDASFIDYIASTFACKAAVKAGDPLNPEERKHLIDKLFATSHPYYCPHGRPIIINLSLDDLDKRFERH